MSKSPFFFDIEAGGLHGSRSSIQSISWRGPTSSGNVYAQPTPGSWVSRWSEQNVWKPIQGQQFVSERQALQTFATALEELPPSSTIAGWNIGYQAAPQQPGVRGFDIPMIMTRARKYGLEDRFRSAFGRVNIQDVGQEYAYKLARELTAWQRKTDIVGRGLVEPDLYRQIEGYTKAGIAAKRTIPGSSQSDIAEFLGRGGYKVAGWKQGLLYNIVTGKTFGAHVSEADVIAGQELAGKLGERIFRSEADVAKWGREALRNKLVASAVAPPRPGVTRNFADILETAALQEARGGQYYAGFQSELQAAISGRVSELGGNLEDVRQGRGVIEEAGTIWRESKIARRLRVPEAFGLSEGVDATLRFVSRHKGKLGLGVGLAALWYSEPLSWFSGRDDAYNVIEGLRHGGQAEKMRKSMTPFGSGLIRSMFGSMDEFISAPKTEVYKRMAQWFKSIDLQLKKEIPFSFSLQLPQPTGQSNLVSHYSRVGNKIVQGNELVSEINFNKELVSNALSVTHTSEAQKKALTPLLLGHEASEVYYGRKLVRKHVSSKEVLTDELAQNLHKQIQKSMFGSHLSPGVIVDELLMAAKAGPESFSAIKQLRLSEISNIENSTQVALMNYYKDPSFSNLRNISKAVRIELKNQPAELAEMFMAEPAKMKVQRIREAIRGNATAEGREVLEKTFLPQLAYAQRVRKIIGTFEKKWLPKFSVSDWTMSGEKFSRLETNQAVDFVKARHSVPTAAERRAENILLAQVPTRRSSKFIDVTDQFTKVEGRIPGRPKTGMAARIERIDTDFESPVNLAKAVMRAEKLYKKQIGGLLKKQGFKAKDIQWDVISEVEHGVGSFSIMAKHRGELVAGMSREFGENWIDLAQVEVGKKFRGKGLGRSLYGIEKRIFKKLGYSPETTISSSVVSPITARMQYHMYGSRVSNEELSAFGFTSEGFYNRLLGKKLTHKEFPSVTMTGKLSGGDDAYNTIEGLQHGGLAGKLRRWLTPFSSGWRGLVAVPKELSQIFQGAISSTVGVKGAGALGWRGNMKQVNNIINEMRSLANAKTESHRSQFLAMVDKFEKELTSTPFNSVAVVDPTRIAAAARRKGVPAYAQLRATIKHERFHQATYELKIRTGIEKLDLNLNPWLETRKGRAYIGEGGLFKSAANEEFLANAIGQKELLRKGTASFTTKGVADAYQEFRAYRSALPMIDALPAGGIMKRMTVGPEKTRQLYIRAVKAAKRKSHQAKMHRGAMKQMSEYAKGGQRHLRAKTSR